MTETSTRTHTYAEWEALREAIDRLDQEALADFGHGGALPGELATRLMELGYRTDLDGSVRASVIAELRALPRDKASNDAWARALERASHA